jgi:hypothetical protein
MRNPTRRSFLKPGVRIAPAVSTGGTSEAAIDDGTSRRAFLQGTAGAAAGAAAFLVIPKAATIALDKHGTTAGIPKAVPTARTGPLPAEPVTAYVHDPGRHEVVVMWGQNEKTFKDPVLVQRLLEATR